MKEFLSIIPVWVWVCAILVIAIALAVCLVLFLMTGGKFGFSSHPVNGTNLNAELNGAVRLLESQRRKRALRSRPAPTSPPAE